MPVRPPLFRPRAQPSRQEQNREADARRGSARKRGYSSKWDRASKGFIARRPVCRYCEVGAFAAPRVTASALTDHLYPHRQFAGVFWLRQLWVPCCVECHAAKQSTEREGLAALDRLAVTIGWPTLTAIEGGGSAPTTPSA